MKTYRVYLNAWQSGEALPLTVPDMLELNTTQTGVTITDSNWGTVQGLSTDLSIIVLNEAKISVFQSWGFNKVINLAFTDQAAAASPETETRRIYFSAEKYIEFEGYYNGGSGKRYSINVKRYNEVVSAMTGPSVSGPITGNVGWIIGAYTAEDDVNTLLGASLALKYVSYNKHSYSATYNSNAQNVNFMYRFFNGLRPYDPLNPTDDPYHDGGENEDPDGGDGNYDDTSDDIPVPVTPDELENHSAVGSYMIKLYNPSVQNLQAFNSFLWSSTWDIASFKKLFTDPMECILGLSVIPVQPTTSANIDVYLGNLDTDVQMPLISKQFVDVDCGVITLSEYWGAYLDYNPYTKMTLFLPYIGYVELNIDHFMETNLGVKYKVDVLTGTCVAFVTASGKIINQYSGMCASQIPVSQAMHRNEISSIVSFIGSSAALIGTGVSLGASVGEGAPLAEVGLKSALAAAAYTETTAKNIINSKTTYSHGGGSSQVAGHLGLRKPYIILERPRQSLAVGYNAFVAYPSNMTKMGSSLSGMTIVEAVNFTSATATDVEVAELLSILKGGAIF